MSIAATTEDETAPAEDIETAIAAVSPPPGPLGPGPGADMASVDLGGRCDLFPGTPLPNFDGPGGPAYACRSRRERKAELFATVIDHDLPVRIENLASVRAMEHPALLRVADWGVVDWPPSKRKRFAVVFERPQGRRLFDGMGETREPISEDHIVRGLLPSLASALKEFQRSGITCGAIRPTNLFFKDSSSAGVMIGDCVTTPAGLAQPVLVETIERSMAQPSGRGNGTIGDDLYSLGVTLLVLYLGRNPLLGQTDEEIVTAKIERGSYPALTSAVRLPGILVEPLRGLMSDDPKQRWTLADLDLWLKGRRLSPRQPQIPKKSMRPLEFGEREQWHSRGVAQELVRSPISANALIERGDLDKWLRRSLNDEERADTVQQAIRTASAGSRGGSIEDRTVARVAIALDPPAPVRYKGRAILPDGFGPALAEAMAEGGGGPQPVAEMVLAQFPMFWVNCQTDFRPEFVPLLELFEAQRSILEQTGPGFGVERVLYDLNPALPCQSPLVKQHYALTCADLLTALDAVATSQNRTRDLMDRHIAAFIAMHNKKLNERLLMPLAAGGDPGRRAVAVLSILADTQRRFGPARLPDLCGWLLTQMEPAFKRFNNRQTQEKVKQEAQKVARGGSIEELLKLVDNPEAIKRDERGFLDAKREYESLTRRIDKLKRGIQNRSTIAHGTGRQIAAVVSSILAIVVLVVIVVLMARGGL